MSHNCIRSLICARTWLFACWNVCIGENSTWISISCSLKFYWNLFTGNCMEPRRVTGCKKMSNVFSNICRGSLSGIARKTALLSFHTLQINICIFGSPGIKNCCSQQTLITKANTSLWNARELHIRKWANAGSVFIHHIFFVADTYKIMRFKS